MYPRKGIRELNVYYITTWVRQIKKERVSDRKVIDKYKSTTCLKIINAYNVTQISKGTTTLKLTRVKKKGLCLL